MHSRSICSLLLVCAWASAGAGDPLLRDTRAASRLELLGLVADGPTITRAITARQRPLVKMLLAAATDVNGVDAAGGTPLVAAALAGEWEIVTTLLAAGADVNASDARKTTPLMAAAGRGHVATIRALLDRGADVNAVDEAGHNASHYALAGKKLDALQTLLPLEAAPSAEDRDALALAVETQDWRFVGPILERSPGGAAWDFPARSALAQALKEKSVEKAHAVISKHAGNPCPEDRNQPLLAYAVAVNDLPLARLLLDAGADPNTTLGSTVDPEFVDQLGPKFLKHYVAEEPGMTVLMLAAGLGHTEFVRMLLDKGASRGQSTPSKYHLVALYFAAWGEHTECIQALLGNAPSSSEVRIDVDLSSQNVTLYKDSVPVLSSAVSTGRAGYATPTGRFVVTDKKQNHVSTIYKVPMPFFMRLNCRDFGMHEGHVTGSPVSHGCIRLPGDVARRLFKEVPIGTLVTITR